MPEYLCRKDPDELQDYTVDWASFLGADTIATSSWSVPAGLTNSASSKTTTTATVWLSGGTGGYEYEVTNTITTAAGRTYEKSMIIPVLDD